ncbi:MAG: OmpA family protein [Hyphomonadaceae bacterium]|nr:OmpA family protein [Hyphomonadaceae bacterium]
MAKLFISYRRSDTQYQADRLHTAIRPHVEDPARNIFIDIDNVPLGVNFATYVDEKVSQCEVLLALIGPDWLEARAEDGKRRLDDPEDFVRIEIASALKRGIPVVPVLFDDAPVPRPEQLPEDLKELSLRNGVQIRRATFEEDVVRLVTGLKFVEPKPPPPSNGIASSETSNKISIKSLLRTLVPGIFIFIIIIAIGINFTKPYTDKDKISSTSYEMNKRFCAQFDQDFIVYFERDTYDVTSAGSAVLDQALSKANEYKSCKIKSISITGHTDRSQPELVSIAMSKSRANAVADALFKRGINHELIDIQWRGESELAVETDDGAREPLNRRAVVKITLDPS